MDFSVDTKELVDFFAALIKYPEKIQAATARYMRDMAYNYKKFAVDALDSRYTIRDRKFVEKTAWKMEVPNESDPIDKQRATVASLRIESGSGGLFTGWEEEIYGLPREMRAKGGRSHRQVWSNARQDSSVYGLMLNQYRLRMGGSGYNSDRIPDSANYGELNIRQFLAMIAKSDASGNSKRAKKFKGKDYALGKNKVFIMEDGAKHPRGLYTFLNGKVKALQTFNENPVVSDVGKFDWQSEAVSVTDKKFTPEYIWIKYLRPVINRIWEKE